MNPKTTEELFEAYEKLPQEVQAAIADINTEGRVFEIGENNKLRIDQIGELADEVGLALLGFTRLDEFTAHVKSRLNVAETEAGKIADEINSQIFTPIKGALQRGKSVRELGGDKKGEEKPTDNKTIFEEKMVKLFRLPREEVDLSEATKPPNDPYLEPLEN